MNFLRSTYDLLNLVDFFDGSGDEGGASVGDGLTTFRTDGGVPDLDPVHFELPVSLPCHRDVDHRGNEVLGVRPTQNHFASFLFVTGVAVQIEATEKKISSWIPKKCEKISR